MRKNLVVGILRETKKFERRTPLVPSDVKWLLKRGVKVEVQKSSQRVFTDRQYLESGARVVNKFKEADLLVGVKEPLVEDLIPDKIYMVFSHTIKGQFKNMPLLRACLKKKVTLIDYEKIVDMYGRRLVYFGRFAGICGMIDSLHYLGKKLQWQGIKNPFSLLKPAHKYGSLKEARLAMRKVYRRMQSRGLGEKLSPFIVGITGHGNVSKGAQEILRLLNPSEIHPRDMLQFVRHQRKRKHKLYKIVFLREEKLRSRDGRGFYFEEYLENPARFESNLDKYLPYINVLIHTSYWDKKFPRMVTKKMVHRLASGGPFRLEFIGDLSCDLNGSIELTYRITDPSRPVYTYIPEKKKFLNGYKSRGITVLAVDNLPSEMPQDASREFSSLIREHVYQIAAHGVKDITRHMAIPAEVRRAVITQGGALTKDFRYLEKYRSSKNS